MSSSSGKGEGRANQRWWNWSWNWSPGHTCLLFLVLSLSASRPMPTPKTPGNSAIQRGADSDEPSTQRVPKKSPVAKKTSENILRAVDPREPVATGLAGDCSKLNF